MSTSATTLKIETPFQRFCSSYFSSKLATIAFITLIAITLIAIFAPWLSPQNPYDLGQVDIMDSRLPPGSESFSGMPFLLGTDGAGRDMLSAMFYGLRISLSSWYRQWCYRVNSWYECRTSGGVFWRSRR